MGGVRQEERKIERKDGIIDMMEWNSKCVMMV